MSRGISALALWLLGHLAPRNEPLAGDLLEQFRAGRSVVWLWSQLLYAIATGIVPPAARARGAESDAHRSDRRRVAGIAKAQAPQSDLEQPRRRRRRPWA